MSEELKGCPFCGGSGVDHDYAEMSCSQEIMTSVICIECGAMSKGSSAGNLGADQYWNTRPIEEALLKRAEAAEARVAELEAEVKRLKTVWMDENILRCPDCGAEYIKIAGGDKCKCLECGGVAVMVEETRR